MTLGQHIQTLRKEAGYSQEALGEALGVTRQSISKWESDQAIPEVEKLVTLSRLFQVPVGVLLQVEENQAANLPEGPLESPPPPKRSIWSILFAGAGTAVVIWLLLLTASLFSRVHSLEESLSEVRMELAALQAGLDEAKVQAGANADLSASVVLESVDYPAGEAVFSLTAAPETVREDMEVFFSAVSDEFPWEYIQARGQLNASGQFVATLTCPLADSITFSVVFDSGETKEVRTLTGWYGLLSESCPWVECYTGLTEDAIRNGVLLWDGPVELKLHAGSVEEVPVEPEALELRLYHNGGAVWGPIAVDLSQTSGDRTVQVPISIELEVEAGDVLRLVAYDRDSLGRDWLERICEYFVEAGPEGPLLVARDQIIPYRMPLVSDWASLDSDSTYWGR